MSFVSSDIDSLRRVIVHAPGVEMRRVALLANEDHPSLPYDAMPAGAIAQHDTLVKLLRDEGAEVLFLDRLLDSALHVARQRNELEGWIRRNFARGDELVEFADELTADELLGRRPSLFYRYDERGFAPLVGPSKWLIYVRDFAVMTPRGLVLTQFGSYDKTDEAALAELVLRFAPELGGYQIVFDARSEEVFLQGGDLIVLDESTLILGAGSLSETRAAERLAQRLEMEVLAVSMAPLNQRESGYAGWTGVHHQFLHLDSAFALVDRGKVLVVPYLMEERYAERNPFVDLLDAFERDLDLRQGADAVRHKKRWPTIAAAREALEAIGWVTRYEPGTGHPTPLGTKLADLMRERGYEVIPVGGRRASLPMELYLLERVLFELNLQAANVVAVRPGAVIANDGNEHTLGALRAAGVTVLPFSGSDLAAWHGGPHCLTLPLERTAS